MGASAQKASAPIPEITLEEARIPPQALGRRRGGRRIDPVGHQPRPKAAHPVKNGAPTFAECANQHIGLHEGGWKNSKHHAQWVMTLTKYATPIRSKPVNEISTATSWRF